VAEDSPGTADPIEISASDVGVDGDQIARPGVN